MGISLPTRIKEFRKISVNAVQEPGYLLLVDDLRPGLVAKIKRKLEMPILQGFCKFAEIVHHEPCHVFEDVQALFMGFFAETENCVENKSSILFNIFTLSGSNNSSLSPISMLAQSW